MTQIVYTPGVCNIGPAEIARRRNVGWVGLAATAVLAAALFYFNVSPIWRITIFLPAFVMASGFVQAYMNFCVGFAQSGVFNFGALGKTEAVANDDQSKAKDAKRAAQLYLYIIGIAILVTVLAFLI
jgi:hypothetical protein